MPASEQGNLTNRYTLVPRTLIFLTQGEKVLLLKGAPDKKLWANRYNGIGGHVERGEDVLSAAYREMLEETGLLGIELRLCGTITIDTGKETGIGLFVFRGESQSGELKPSHEGSLEWIGVQELAKLPLVEDLNTLLPVILDMQQGSVPFCAHYHYEADQLQITFGGKRRG